VREASSLAVILAILLASHLTIVTILGEPQGVDTWPLINMAEKTIMNPGLSLTSDRLWSGYNNRWPGTTILSIITTETLGITVKQTYMYILPFTLEATIVIGLYTFMKRIAKHYATIGVGITVFSPPIYMFLQEPVKEVLSAAIAIPLATLLLAAKIDRTTSIPLIILTLGAVISHPLTPLMLALIGLTTMTIARTLQAMNIEQLTVKPGLLPALIFITATYIFYNTLFGLESTSYATAVRDYTLIYLLYLYFAATLYIFYHTTTNRATGLTTLILIALGTTILILGTHNIPQVNRAPTGYTLYVGSFLIALLALTPIIRAERNQRYSLVKHISGAALLVAGSMTLFIATYAQTLLTIIHRVINYFYPFMGLATAYAAHRRKLIPALALIALLIASLTLTTLYIQDKDPVRYTWRYTTGETSGYNEIARLSNTRLLGDQKTQYYYTYLHQVNQPTNQQGTEIVGKGLFIIYRDMLRYGYWSNPTNIINPQAVKQATKETRGTVYNNGLVEATLLG